MRMLLFLLAVPLNAGAQWTFEAEAARRYDDNLSRAQRQSDIIRDRVWTAHGVLGHAFAVGTADLSLQAELRGARHDNYAGVDHRALGAGATWRRKLGLGLTAPWVALEASLLAEDYEARLRDGRRTGAAAILGKRFDERFEASLRAAYDRRAQREEFPTVPGLSGDPFSLQGRSLTLRASYAFSARGLAYASAATRRGDVVSSTRRNPDIFRESAALAPDPAFGPDFIAYRLTGARTTSWSAGLSWALGRRAAVDAAISRDITSARGGLDYDGNVYSLAVVYRD